MKLKDKFPILSDAGFVKTMVDAVYGTMQLEGQGVLKEKLVALYEADHQRAKPTSEEASTAVRPNP